MTKKERTAVAGEVEALVLSQMGDLFATELRRRDRRIERLERIVAGDGSLDRRKRDAATVLRAHIRHEIDAAIEIQVKAGTKAEGVSA